jgi:hypothetical protein
MSYDIPRGALTPPLVVTITDTVPINVSDVDLIITDESGNVVLVDPAPIVNASNPLSVIVTHNWSAGQTDVSGTFGVQVDAGGLYPGSGPLTFTIGLGTLAGYCSIAQARAAGATGTDQQVADAIVAARKRIDRYCSDTFAPTRMEVVTNVRADGTALLHRRVRSVETVTPVGRDTPVTEGAYLVTSSRTPGQVDAVLFGAGGERGDALIVGAEPWNGGWANLIGSLATGQIEVVGSFGWDETPAEVITASASLAALITGGGAGVGPDVDDDGNVVRVTAAPIEEARGQTTGNAAVDAQLQHLRDDRVRLSY